MKLFILLTLICLFNLHAFAPDWVANTPSGYLNDYFVGRGSSENSQTEAIENALGNSLTAIIKSNSFSVSADQSFNSHSREEFYNGESLSLKNVSELVQEIKIKGETTKIRGLKEVERYLTEDDGRYDAFVLVKIPAAKPQSPPNEFSPVWRSVFLPGWGQLFKNEPFTGWSLMTLTVAGVGGGLALNQLSTKANDDAVKSRTQKTRDFYNQRSNDLSLYSKLSFAAAGVFYIWSLSDAIIAKPKNLFVDLQKQGSDDYKISLSYGINLK